MNKRTAVTAANNLIKQHGITAAASILESFVSQVSADMAELQAIDDYSSELFKRRAHRIASASGMLNVLNMRNLALQIEQKPTAPSVRKLGVMVEKITKWFQQILESPTFSEA